MVVLAVFSAAMAAIIGASFLVTPDQLERGEVALSPPCLFRRLLHRPCLHCGLTRAFTAISRGEVARALGYNRLSIFFYVLVWASALWGSVGLVRAFSQYRHTSRTQHNMGDES